MRLHQRQHDAIISIHALRKESDSSSVTWLQSFQIFQSTLSVRRATSNQQTMQLADIFQSTLSVRRATTARYERSRALQFQSTLSVRRATRNQQTHRPKPDISIHALRKESDSILTLLQHHVRISIHALRKESDARLVGVVKLQCISIHALRKESDGSSTTMRNVPSGFQSTLSVRRATIHAGLLKFDNSYFNPRSP